MKEFTRMDNVKCLICNHTYNWEAPLNSNYNVSEDAVRAEAIVDTVPDNHKRINTPIFIHVKCPDCGVKHEYKVLENFYNN
ncbi:hypothetical protein TMU01_00040 [Tenuibacillus multivorans]|uniref:Uncharacterized protein n=2 Tax=Tenuibacillus multivorans TaxID=237069 RepID=A0A1G9XRK0_9BACI|nr:hypothetical protein [Tenuibacillus multivorans]GEL75769.1 hypothetical protein TMU01_00040 [Tenuibacillus multivorans]SDM98873.1 hypothetical protein SAMN05216498_1063 [Tenuibacillus multivorans]